MSNTKQSYGRAILVDGYQSIHPIERARGKNKHGQWIFGRKIGADQIGNVGDTHNLVGYTVDPNTICWCTGIKNVGDQEQYLFENDLVRDEKGVAYQILRKNSQWILATVSNGSITDQETNLIDHLDCIEKRGGFLVLIRNAMDIPASAQNSNRIETSRNKHMIRVSYIGYADNSLIGSVEVSRADFWKHIYPNCNDPINGPALGSLMGWIPLIREVVIKDHGKDFIDLNIIFADSEAEDEPIQFANQMVAWEVKQMYIREQKRRMEVEKT